METWWIVRDRLKRRGISAMAVYLRGVLLEETVKFFAVVGPYWSEGEANSMIRRWTD